MDMPWARNCGRFDLPSSGRPGEKVAEAPPPAPVAAPPPKQLRRGRR